MIFEEGRQFANFKIIRKLGEGGMGEVYLAEDQKLGRNIALKILQSEFFDDPDRLSRFTREAKTAAKISHASVMAIYDLDRVKDEVSGREISYIVMENITGQTLGEYLKIRTPANAELLRISERIASGLAAAHQLKIVHRDIKYDNIKIDDTGEAKILDFGLAKPLDVVIDQKDADLTRTSSNELTQEGKIMGTVSYMSPEQARGGPIDTRSDIFSFGILIYRMFSGVSPFEGPDKVSVMAKILEGRQEPLRQKNESIPAELERIIDKCLQKDPNDRYQDTRDLVVDLRSLRRQHDSAISESSSMIADVPKIKKASILDLSWKKVILAVATLFALVAVFIIGPIIYYSLTEGSKTPEEALALVENLGVDINKILDDAGVPGRGSLKLPTLPIQANALAILGFDNKTGNTELDWLQAGLPEILLTDLAQSGVTNLIGRGRVLDCLPKQRNDTTVSISHQECVTAARSLGAARVLSGTFYKMGDKIRIDARLEDVASGQIILAEKVVGEDPFVLVDSLTNKIAQSMDIQNVGSSDLQVANITSSSPEAYREYIHGMEEFRLSKYDSANVYFEEAIKLDSTFALPYMRIGMGFALRGRNQQAIKYMGLAQKFEDRLPVKEKSLLDIHKDLWFKRQYDDGVVKLRAYVANYPNDKEARSFYALLLFNLKKDKDAALAQLDTVMALDSRYLMALTWYITIHMNEEEYDKAIEYSLLMRQYYPRLPTPYQNLMSLYLQQGRREESVNAARDLLSKFPSDAAALSVLSVSFIRQRQFDSAAFYIEERGRLNSDDPYRMIAYNQRRSNLEFWLGNFKQAMDEQFKSLERAMSIGDSGQIVTAYRRISTRYTYLKMDDSALFYNKEAYQYTDDFQKIDYYLTLAEVDVSSIPRIRTEFEDAITNFRARLPKEMWGLADEILNIFNAAEKYDTTAAINAYMVISEKYSQNDTENRELIGRLNILSGNYEEGKKYLNTVLSGVDETTQARHYIRSLYYYGIAEEALSNTEAALEAYREVLKYWGDADIELTFVKDARERLANLTS